jgi:hypothetical protein
MILDSPQLAAAEMPYLSEAHQWVAAFAILISPNPATA